LIAHAVDAASLFTEELPNNFILLIDIDHQDHAVAVTLLVHHSSNLVAFIVTDELLFTELV
jgi:hypothetical protein